MADNGWVGRQRVPMLKASTLEDRTRPAIEESGWMPGRVRYIAWLNGSAQARATKQGTSSSDTLLARR